MDYTQGADLPDLSLTWYDTNGALIDFSSGYSFTVKVAPLGSTTASFTKTTNITGSASAPNLVVAWGTSEIGNLGVGTYDVQVQAHRAADSKDRFFPSALRLNVKAAIS